ncbi:MAG: 16S rRNA (guanine(527)-N(7))-methyltransferase RsmG [Brevinematia bacterium]
MEKIKKEKLQIYVNELLNWNQAYNLIGKSTEKEIWETHIENSLEVLPFLAGEEGRNIVDIGTGAGLPSIPLSIFLPEKTFYLTEVNLKKLAFLTFISKKLNLNTRIVNINEGFFLKEECLVISRAFSTIREIIKWENKHLASVLSTYLLKGRLEKIEFELKEANLEKFRIVELKKGNLVIF